MRMVDPCSACALPRPPVTMKKFEFDGLASSAASSHILMADSCTTGVVPKDRASVTSFDPASFSTVAKDRPILMINEGPTWCLSRNYVYMTVLREVVHAGLVIPNANNFTSMTYPCSTRSVCRARVCVIDVEFTSRASFDADRPSWVVDPCPARILSRNRENMVGLDLGGLPTFTTGNPSLRTDTSYTCPTSR